MKFIHHLYAEGHISFFLAGFLFGLLVIGGFLFLHHAWTRRKSRRPRPQLDVLQLAYARERLSKPARATVKLTDSTPMFPKPKLNEWPPDKEFKGKPPNSITSTDRFEGPRLTESIITKE